MLAETQVDRQFHVAGEKDLDLELAIAGPRSVLSALRHVTSHCNGVNAVSGCLICIEVMLRSMAHG